MVGHWKQSNALEEPHVVHSLLPKTTNALHCTLQFFTRHCMAGCALTRGDSRKRRLSFKPKGSSNYSPSCCTLMFLAQVYQGVKGAVHTGGTGELPPGACGGLLLPHLVGGDQLLLGEGLAGGADRLCCLLDLPLTISPSHLPSLFTSGLDSFSFPIN